MNLVVEISYYTNYNVISIESPYEIPIIVLRRKDNNVCISISKYRNKKYVFI